MLHELLLACLGFPGDIIVESLGTYKVRDNFELMTTAEIEQVNKVAPLGWFCSTLSSYANMHITRRWNEDRKDIQLYKSALCTGILDLLDEYTVDIANFECRLASLSGPTSLSYLTTYLQKV